VKNIVSYIGSKQKLLPFLMEIFNLSQNKFSEKQVFVDLFAGTCAVSKHIFNHYHSDVIINGISLLSSVLIDELSFHTLDKNKMFVILNEINELGKISLNEMNVELEPISGHIFNEFSINGIPKSITVLSIFDNQEIKSRMFFSEIVGKKIDAIRNYLKKSSLNEIEKNFINLFLLNYANKNANTTSVFGSYLKKLKHKKEHSFLDLSLFETFFINKNNNKNSYSKFQLPAIDCLKQLNKDNKENTIIYMNPPYNTRSYESNYHILDYILDLNFNPNTIKLNSKTGMQLKKIKNPFVSKKDTKIIMKELIETSLLYSNTIFISYNNEGVFQESDMKETIDELKFKYHKIKLKTYYQEYKRFTSGENNGINNSKKIVYSK